MISSGVTKSLPLSAAAAHELGTPLNTIFLVLNDLLKEKKLIEDGVLKEHGDPKKSSAGKRDAGDVSPKHGVQKDNDPKRRKRKK